MKYKIPLFETNLGKEEELVLTNVLRSGWLSMGPKCEELENKFSAAIGTDYGVSLSSCTAALHLALKVMNIGEGDEVLLPSLTFVATVNAVKYVGAKPVFCDIVSTGDLTISPQDIEKKITKKSKAIIVMHYAGFACDMDKICGLSRKYNLKIIEDACHAPLSQYKSKNLGTFGDISCYSFFSNKNIGIGEGGMLLTSNKNYYKRAKLLRSHGMTTMSYERAKGHAQSYDVVDLGYNYRMDDIRAALAIVQLEKLKEDLIKRQKIREKYIELLRNIKDIIIPFKDRKDFSSNYIFPIVLKNGNRNKRDKVREVLAKKGIQTSVHYPLADKFSIYKDSSASLPLSEYVSDCEITMPMYAELSEDDIFYIVRNIENEK